MPWTAADYLQHHGILGMHWGKRNGPPYPLGASDHSASEKRAGWQKSLGKGSDSDRAARRKKILKTSLKVGAGLAVAGLAVYGAYKLNESGLLDKSIDIGKNRVIDILGIEDGVKDQQKVNTFTPTLQNIQSCAANVNPSQSKTNCGSTSTAVIQNIKEGPGKYEAYAEVPEHMRREGGQGYDPDKLIDCYEGGTWDKIPSEFQNRSAITAELEKRMLAHGNGSCGIFYIEKIRKKSTGHYFSWIVLDNKVNIVEGQIDQAGIVWNKNLYNDVGQLIDPMFDVKIARLDNCTIKPGREVDLFRKRE